MGRVTWEKSGFFAKSMKVKDWGPRTESRNAGGDVIRFPRIRRGKRETTY